MNSDPYDSAAWRTFGMLDADESAIFDEAMRHDPLLRGAYLEMDRLSAAIAATTTVPIPPRAGQLERLRNRLGLEPTARRSHWWFGISGWAAAAALALLIVLRSPEPEPSAVVESTGAATATPPARPGSAATNDVPAASTGGSLATSGAPAAADHSNDSTLASQAQAQAQAPAAGGATKAETKRLVQEIAVLRENLEKFQRRDRILFDAVPGIALPVVMTMSPPGKGKDDELSPTLTTSDGDSTITALLGDALAAMTRNQGAPMERTLEGAAVADVSNPGDAVPVAPPAVAETPLPLPPELPALGAAGPSAIPIYDMARDSGTLVVNNLPQIAEDESYNLWVTTETSTAPIYVGSLPQATGEGAESFDFSLGSTTVLPSGFVLTKDTRDTPKHPSESNTVLQGPPVPER